MDTEACPITTSAKDASDVPSPIHPAIDVATCVDDGSGYAVSAYDVTATCVDDHPGCAVFAYDVAAIPGHATFAMGAPDIPSSVCSPADAATSCTPPVDATPGPAPLPLASGVTPSGS